MSKLIDNLCRHYNYKATLTTAEERYEKTWNSYLELLNKKPKASLVSITKLKSVCYRGMTKWMSHNGLSVYDAKALVSFLSLYLKGDAPCSTPSYAREDSTECTSSNTYRT